MQFLKSEKSVKKILFTGLDNGGKTSIIHALEREFSNIAIINPTKGAQRRIFKFLDLEISEWDLGGQSKYRISYIRNPDKYFDNTEVAIFVIDIQDEKRIIESLSYLKDVVEEFKKLKIKPPLNIFFHKYDPLLEKKEDKQFEKKIKELLIKIMEEMELNAVKFYKTSIFSIDTLITAISQILLELYPKSQLIDKTLKEFAIRINADALLLVDNNSLIISSYSKNQASEKLLKKALIYFLSLNDLLKKSKVFISDSKDYILIQKSNNFVHFREMIIKDGDFPYYLLCIKKGQFFYKDDINTLCKVLREIIYS